MTTKPRPRKAPATKAAAIDPIFAAIAAVKAAEKELYRCGENDGADGERSVAFKGAWSDWHAASMRLHLKNIRTRTPTAGPWERLTPQIDDMSDPKSRPGYAIYLLMTEGTAWT